jgi:hypothetical protein
VVDRELLRPGNVIRHISGLSFVGRPKVFAVAAEIFDRAPDCEVYRHFETWDQGELRALIEPTDVVVDATAVPAFELLLNEVCLSVGRPLVAAAAFQRANVGRVRITSPCRDACVLCYEGGYVPSDPGYPVIPAGEEGEFVESGCGVPTVEATALDVDVTANVAARAVLQLLRERHDGVGGIAVANHALIVNEVVEGLRSAPHGEILTTPGLHWSRWTPRPGCDACGGGGTLISPTGAAGLPLGDVATQE